MFTSRSYKTIRTVTALIVLAVLLLQSGGTLPARAAPQRSDECLPLERKIEQVLGRQAAFRIGYDPRTGKAKGAYVWGWSRGSIYLRDYSSHYIFFWSRETCAHEVHGAILDRYMSLYANGLNLGLPITDELPTPDGIGRFNHFQYGSIYWHPDVGAYTVYGAIRDHWASMGWELSWLGYPTSNELPTADGQGGRISQFQNGYIMWYPDNRFKTATWAKEFSGKAVTRLVVGDLASIRMTSRDSETDEMYFDCFGSYGVNTFENSSAPYSAWARWFRLKPSWHAYGLILWDGHLNDNDVAAIHCLLIEDDAHKTYFKPWNIIKGAGALVGAFISGSPEAAVAGTKEVISGIQSHGNQVVAAFRVVIKKTPEGIRAEWTPLDDTFVNQVDNTYASMTGQGGGGEYLLNLHIVAP